MTGLVSILRTLVIFTLAAVCEIGGGWLIWKAARDGKPTWWGLAGAILLIVFGILPTLQPSNFGRVFAVYGGFFIAMSLLWGWGFDSNQPDIGDVIGGAVALVGAGLILYWPREATAIASLDSAGKGHVVASFVVVAKTQPVPGRVGVVSPVAHHRVREVLVSPGDRVTAGQVLVRLGSDDADLATKKSALAEWQARLADRRGKSAQQEQAEARAALDEASGAAQQARKTLEGIDPLWAKGNVSEQRHRKAQSAQSVAEAEEKVAAARLERLLKQPADLEIAELEARVAAAKATLEAARGEIQQVIVAAPLTGVVSRMDVQPGMRAEAGAPTWGEILDLSEIDVRCDLTPQEADGVAVGDTAEVTQEGVQYGHWTGQVVNVGSAADQQSGKVPVLVRVKNGGERLRCYVEVSVHFGGERPGDEEKEVPKPQSNGVDRSRRGRPLLPARV